MNDNNKQQLEQQLWNIANTLRGKMGADDFRDYILGFIFYKYLSEKIHSYADKVMEPDGILYKEIDETTPKGKKYLKAFQAEALDTLGYFLKYSELLLNEGKREACIAGLKEITSLIGAPGASAKAADEALSMI